MYELPDPRGLVKLYPSDSRVDLGGVGALIEWRHQLSERDRRRIDLTASWPHRVVEFEGRFGVTMAKAPARFFDNVEGLPTPRDLQWAISPAARFSGRDLITPREALAVVYRCVQTLSVIHRNGVVYGDLSSTNLLWSAEGRRTSIFLLDCDAAWRTTAARPQPHAQTALFVDPWIATPSAEQMMRSDLYKLGVLFLRLYYRVVIDLTDKMRVLELPNSPPITPRVRQLIKTALAKGGSRPTAEDWLRPLEGLDRAIRLMH